MMETLALPLLKLCRRFPSAAEGGASKEVGLSVDGEVGAGLVGVTVEDVVTMATGGAEPGEGGVKPGGRIRRPGLFRGGAGAEPRVRLAWSFSIRAEFLLGGDETPAGGCVSPAVGCGSCRVRGGRRLTGLSSGFPAVLLG